ncbi:alcohol dehydrogenase [Variovorax sp. WS11]|uniref:cytochrome c n=1 Tax=Variovorax sp. WS11 TaxID=1105204 RepID=UPI000D0E151D|nr:cytochrome c [Variovorax sp. WS11]NDZ15573.1 c-type cytochrome [Variovorax sp. WS11]PSL83335.1 alcohol dehydrogenase [Variovorax sp. WS11]
MRRTLYILLALAALLIAAALGLVALNLRGEEPLPETPAAFNATPAQVERGRYLALAGNCAGCHTTRGGTPYAGGVGIETPFGTVFAGNLTPHQEAGIGRWSAAHFWRALHNGRSMDGRLLYPAFPYPSFTRVTREDSDAIYAYLRTVPPAPTPNTAHKLRFPYDTQAALAVWRALFFAPGSFVADPAKPPEWNRGAYLVEGLGHCIACHGTRNVLGATEEKLGLSGGLIPVENWYAPSLNAKREAGVADWDTPHVVALLKNGTSPRGSVMGPMADVVFRSTQHLSEADLNAMAVFLKQLPEAKAADTPAPEAPVRRDAGVMARGAKIYDQQCAYCHGDAGQGAEGAYPALAGSRSVNMGSAVNLVQVLRHGGFLPATAGNPRPYGMPPFGHVLDDDGIAAVLSFIRGSWGNDAPPVTRGQIIRP